jgi:Leucine-rich repeat (LRR) protein
MANLAGPRLLQAFFEYATDDVVDTMNNSTKVALRLSCKNAKAFVDGTVTAARGNASTLETILGCDWHLSELCIEEVNGKKPTLSRDAFTSLLNAVCSKFPMLQELNLNCPPVLYNLPANIGQLSKLRTLKTADCPLTALPASFGQLSSLERLELCKAYGVSTLSRPTIEGLAPLKQLTQLKYLKLDGLLMDESFFPNFLASCNFPVLEDLILGDHLLSLSSSISIFSNLTALIIEESILLEVPESIGCLELLKKCCILAGAVSLPSSFSKLTSLEELDVTTDTESFFFVTNSNKLTKLKFTHRSDALMDIYPEYLWTFTSLKNLDLSWSTVHTLPDGLGNLQNLESLHIRGMQNVEELPDTIGNLTSLTSLSISECFGFSKLPESIGNLKLLRELLIYVGGIISTLPDSIGQLQSLEKLCLPHIEHLPSSIGNLRALKELSVHYAEEVFFPESFADLVLDMPVEECSLERVAFDGDVKFVTSSPGVCLALGVLWQRGILRCQNLFF